MDVKVALGGDGGTYTPPDSSSCFLRLRSSSANAAAQSKVETSSVDVVWDSTADDVSEVVDSV